MSPEDAARGGLDTLPDAELPMLAAGWLAEGYDSESLRQVAGLSRADSLAARRLMPDALASIGHPFAASDQPWDQSPWLGYWSSIAWAVHQIDRKLSPYSAAQQVIEIAGDVPDLWEPSRGAELTALLRRWDSEPDRRLAIEVLLREQLRALKREDVPPLRPPG